MLKSIVKSLLLNVAITGGLFLVAYLISFLDSFLLLPSFKSNILSIIGLFIITIGFIVRVYASATFYENKLSVVRLRAQNRLVTQGPYKLSRNPLYIGLTLIFLGFAVLLGTTAGVIAAIIHFIAWHIWVVNFEEKSLERKFGNEHVEHKEETPRWL